jgi:hypothetical protein
VSSRHGRGCPRTNRPSLQSERRDVRRPGVFRCWIEMAGGPIEESLYGWPSRSIDLQYRAPRVAQPVEMGTKFTFNPVGYIGR